MAALPYLDADAITSTVSWSVAIDAIADAVDGLGSAPVAPRTIVPTAQGELMLMPAETATSAGVKVLTVAPGNPARGRPRIQAVYVLFDALTLTPRALLDGAALTTLRTPAVSAFAARALAPVDAATLIVFGSGPQAQAHVHAISSIRPVREVIVVGRDPERADSLVAHLVATGIDARTDAAESVRSADIVVCATTARTSVFDGSLLAERACVLAVGSHEPEVREVDDIVFRRAKRVVVEDTATALREAGDVILAISAGALAVTDLLGLADIATMRPEPGISIFKSVGMGWQDLALAEAAVGLAGVGGSTG